MYGSWRLRQDEWGSVIKHIDERMDMSVFYDKLEAMYVFNLAMFTRNFKASQHSKGGLGYCMLPSRHRALPFLDRAKNWWNATMYKPRHRK